MVGPDDLFGILLLTALCLPGLASYSVRSSRWRWQQRAALAAAAVALLCLVLGVGLSVHRCHRGQPYVPCLWFAVSCVAWIPTFERGWQRLAAAAFLVTSAVPAGVGYTALVHTEKLVGDRGGVALDRQQDVHRAWHTPITGILRVGEAAEEQGGPCARAR